ncbi:MAG: tetraacyldisaccharide 4'-kinase [Planctomycetaceae bacterium]|jgi:tetraacyldisaccharide 4'-kinase|nr:tetraacyldisaccharide 4'-kinase [Planctomycetaceae bacterium]
MEEWFRQLVSGKRCGIRAGLLRIFFCCISFFYWFVSQCRNFLYDYKILKIHKVDIPVISVGNLTLGGTGKSPMVAWLCEYFIEQGKIPAIISRGYRRKNTKSGSESNLKSESKLNLISGKSNAADNADNDMFEVNDEYLELAFRVPDVYHFQNRDRVVAIRKLLSFAAAKGSKVDLAILDDGMQHRRLKRDFEIVLLDAMEPFGYGYIFPRGMLRESVRSLDRADVILLSRADLISAEERKQIEAFVNKITSKAIYAEIIHTPQKIFYFGGNETNVKTIREKNILAFCGIGNPNAFYATVKNISDGRIRFEKYPDHYGYTKNDVIEIVQKAIESNVDLILCTMKDFVKINQILKSDIDSEILESLQKIPIAALIVQIKFLNNESMFKNALNKIIVNIQ